MQAIGLSCACEFKAVQSDVTTKVLAMARLVAVPAAPVEGDRAPLNVLAVLDKSGSMGGEKISLVKKTLQFMLTQLQAQDRFSVITFSNDAQTLVPLQEMTMKAKEEVFQTLKKITADGSTNISDGLFTALDQIKASQGTISSKHVTSVILMTDGEMNCGMKDSASLVAALKERLATLTTPVSIFTMGYGGRHNDELLKSIAESASGLYYFLENEEKIPDSFADCLGGLVSVVAQNIKVTTTALSGARLVRLLVGGLRTSPARQPDGTTVHEVTLGDLYSEETRNVVCEIELPALAEPADDWSFVQFKLSYFDVINAQVRTSETVGTLSRPATVSDADRQVDVELDQQRNRILVATSLEEANRIAKDGKLADAREIIQTTLNTLRNAVSFASPLCQELEQDLKDCLAGLVDRSSYETSGSKAMTSYSMMHTYQRSNRAGSSYTTTSKRAMVNSSRGYYEDLNDDADA